DRRKARDFKPVPEAFREFVFIPEELIDPVESKRSHLLYLLSRNAVNEGATVPPYRFLGNNFVMPPGGLIGLGLPLQDEALEGFVLEGIPQRRASPALPSEQIHAPIGRAFIASLGGIALPTRQILGVESRIILGKVEH